MNNVICQFCKTNNCEHLDFEQFMTQKAEPAKKVVSKEVRVTKISVESANKLIEAGFTVVLV